MATYKFPQFNTEITTQNVEIDLNTIGDKAVDKLLSVNIVLFTDTARFGVRAEDMPYTTTWDDADVPDMVNQWLTQFIV